MQELTSAPVSTNHRNVDKYKEQIISFLSTFRSPHTRRAYKSDITQWCSYLDTYKTDLVHADRRHAAFYIEMMNKNHSPVTTNRKIGTVSSFYEHVRSEGLIIVNPTLKVHRNRVDQTVSDTAALTIEEANALIASSRKHGSRAETIVTILIHTGIRVSELLNAKYSDLSHDGGYRCLQVTRKGAKRQKIVLNEACLKALDALIGTQISRGTALMLHDSDPFIFETRTGKRMDQPSIYRLIRSLTDDAGIKTHVTPHVLRATHATIALENGVALQHVQDSLGHASPVMTQRYNKARERLKNSSAHVFSDMLN